MDRFFLVARKSWFERRDPSGPLTDVGNLFVSVFLGRSKKKIYILKKVSPCCRGRTGGLIRRWQRREKERVESHGV